eukprot:473984_1
MSASSSCHADSYDSDGNYIVTAEDSSEPSTVEPSKSESTCEQSAYIEQSANIEPSIVVFDPFVIGYGCDIDEQQMTVYGYSKEYIGDHCNKIITLIMRFYSPLQGLRHLVCGWLRYNYHGTYLNALTQIPLTHIVGYIYYEIPAFWSVSQNMRSNQIIDAVWPKADMETYRLTDFLEEYGYEDIYNVSSSDEEDENNK